MDSDDSDENDSNGKCEQRWPRNEDGRNKEDNQKDGGNPVADDDVEMDNDVERLNVVVQNFNRRRNQEDDED